MGDRRNGAFVFSFLGLQRYLEAPSRRPVSAHLSEPAQDLVEDRVGQALPGRGGDQAPQLRPLEAPSEFVVPQ